MRRHPRWSSYLLGALALVALAVAVGSPSEFGGRPIVLHVPARAAAADDHVAFIGVVDARSTQGLANLIGLLALAAFVGATWALATSTPAPARLDRGDACRRWRARLVGAPPVLA